MGFNRRRKLWDVNVWPGFVDVLSTLLMIIIFVLLTFCVYQLYLANALVDKDQALNELTVRIRDIARRLVNEQEKTKIYHNEVITLKQGIKQLNLQIADIESKLVQEKNITKEVSDKNTNLQTELDSLANKIKELNALLDTSEEQKQGLKVTLGENENSIRTLKEQIAKLKEIPTLGKYRSEFFEQLQKVLGKRKDIRVVGDRFVFQSEVFFDMASADLSNDGKGKVKQLAMVLRDILKNIPSNIPWVLRIDGHTDSLPIHNEKYPSNWELSTARAISVVKYLIANGIPEKHLMAAGFAEHHPLSNKKNAKKNRRIECRLDQS
ncbi:MAG: OmpA family protein [Alphaproteobacteria bacterium]